MRHSAQHRPDAQDRWPCAQRMDGLDGASRLKQPIERHGLGVVLHLHHLHVARLPGAHLLRAHQAPPRLASHNTQQRRSRAAYASNQFRWNRGGHRMRHCLAHHLHKLTHPPKSIDETRTRVLQRGSSPRTSSAPMTPGSTRPGWTTPPGCAGMPTRRPRSTRPQTSPSPSQTWARC